MVNTMLDDYLKYLQSNESIFPMDSLHTKKKVLKTQYPEEYTEKDEEPEDE